MPRVRWRSMFWCILNLFWISAVSSDCYYENQKHEEGEQVQTAESCLNCTCTQGTLVCYLRICPELPDPPPPNCIILHKHKTCCPELICEDSPTNSRIEGRSESIIEENNSKPKETSCIQNGTIYGSGSAIDTSSLCEYCYCIAGRQTCVKPKCVLYLDGCAPVFEKYNCCPVRYNCSGFYKSITTETPAASSNECVINNVNYAEGSKISGAGRSDCDNCYCIRGLIRCEPLECSPAIVGCTPVIKPGNCCPDSYNCSGAFGIRTEANYDSSPIVSQEYAKLRKQTQGLRPQHKLENRLEDLTQSTTKASSQFVAESETSRHLQDPSTTGPFSRNIVEHLSTRYEPILDARTRPSTQFRKHTSSLKNPSVKATTTKNLTDTTEVTTKKQLRSSDYDSEFFDIVGSLFDNEIQKETTETATKLEQNPTTDGTTSIKLSDVLTTLLHTLTNDYTTTTDLDSSTFLSTTDFPTEKNSTTITTLVTIKDCLKSNIRHSENEFNNKETTEIVDLSSTVSSTTESDYTEVDLESKLKVATVVGNLYKPNIELLLNMTMSKNKEYEDYDYNEPTLPPSLPNLRIIPFVAADALNTKSREKENTLYLNQVTEGPSYSLFSPPTKTEGGFMPKERPILTDFYDKEYGISSDVPFASVVSKSHEHNCLYAGREIQHRETVTTENCVVCVCFFGNMICQQPPCPLPEPRCIETKDKSSCCPQVVCDPVGQEVDRIDTTENPQDVITAAEGIVMSNNFENVIRTERPPNLQSLIEDVKFLATTEKPTPPAVITERSDLSLGNILDLLLYGQVATEINDVKITQTGQKSEINNADSAMGVGLLKLAGCNIYGRMYRVGRIISELSGPCVECRCTEVGVQCTPLKC